MAKKKSKVLETITNKIKLNNVKKNDLGNFFQFSKDF